MKKLLTLAMACALVFTGCSSKPTEPETPTPVGKSEGVMTYEEYAAAELQTEVTVETYVQAKQSWWDNKGTFYTQDEEGGYFIYSMPCSQEEYDQLVPGTKIKVTGSKVEWAGEIEISDVTAFEVEEGTFIAEPKDVTALVGTDELINSQNQLVTIKDVVIEGIEFQNGEAGPGNDIYVTATVNGQPLSLCVEAYLTSPDTEVYQTVGALEAGATVDVTCFLYWYNGAEPHICAVVAK